MARYGRVNVNDTIACLIRRKTQEIGGLEYISMGIVQAESGFDPGAFGDPADGPTVVVGGRTYPTWRNPRNGRYYRSLGLLQLNIAGGQGTGHEPERLFDPAYNLSVGLVPIAQAIFQATARGYTGERFIREVARSSGHPGFVDLNDARLTKIVHDTLLMALTEDGVWAKWPSCSGVGTDPPPPPPPPIHTWSEGPAPRNQAEAEAAIHRHLDRIGELIDKF